MHSFFLLMKTLTLVRPPFRRALSSQSPLLPSTTLRRIRLKPLLSTCSSLTGGGAPIAAAGAGRCSLASKAEAFPLAGVEEALMGFITGKRKATERKLVKLFKFCHSKVENIVPKDIPVRLVAFNLGYLPGGDKTIVTRSETTLMGLEAASRILGSAGLISIMVYVGHPGGRDELETVQSFASNLPTETWATCKFEMLNRPTGPVLLLLFKK